MGHELYHVGQFANLTGQSLALLKMSEDAFEASIETYTYLNWNQKMGNPVFWRASDPSIVKYNSMFLSPNNFGLPNFVPIFNSLSVPTHKLLFPVPRIVIY